MKKILVFASCIALAVGAASCGPNEGTDDNTNNGDTAVLVEDPQNTLEANPVNDTTVQDTTHMDHNH